MKKLVWVVVGMGLLLVALPWGIGRVAEARLNAKLDQLLEHAPWLTIAERRWTPGWFRSAQMVTFEVTGPWAQALNPRAVREQIERAEAARAEAQASAAEPELPMSPLPRDEEPMVPMPGAAAQEPDVEPADAEIMPLAPPEPIRFTIQNEILHGPVLWPLGFGLARVNSRLVLGEEFEKELIEIFGTAQPVRVSTRVGFFGGGTTTVAGDARTLRLDGAEGTVAYDKFEFAVDYSDRFDRVGLDGSWPRIEYAAGATGESFVVEEMTLTSQHERIAGHLYEGTFRFGIDELRYVDADRGKSTIDDVHYEVETRLDDDFVDVVSRIGTGDIENQAFTELQLELEELHYDFTLRHLHAATLEQLVAAMQDSYSQRVSTAGEAEAAMMQPIKAHGLELLKHDPELVLDGIGIVTSEGAGFIKGVLRLRGVTEEDFEAGTMALLGRLEADLTIELAQKLVERMPNGATGAGMAVDQGFLRRDGDKLVSHIEFKNGELLVNGKAQGIPGLGAPPPGMMPPGGVEPE